MEHWNQQLREKLQRLKNKTGRASKMLSLVSEVS